MAEKNSPVASIGLGLAVGALVGLFFQHAMPTLIEAFESYNEEDAQTVLQNLQSRRCRRSGEGDLRSFNFGRRAAGEAFRLVGLERPSEESCTGKPAE